MISQVTYTAWQQWAWGGFLAAAAGDKDEAKRCYEEADKIGATAIPGSPFLLNPDLCLRRHFPGESQGVVQSLPPDDNLLIGIQGEGPYQEAPSAKGLHDWEFSPGALRQIMAVIADTLEPEDTEQPHLQVMSSGRCGTMSLYHLLERSHYLPYHGYFFNPGANFRNAHAHALLQGTAYEAPIAYWYQCRKAEWIGAEESGMPMATLNHYDTPFAPIFAAAHKKARFIYLRRDPVNTFRSFFMKGQWGNQIRPMFTSFKDGFQWRDCRYDEPVAIAWYLAFTEFFCRAFGSTGVNWVELSSDLLFAQDDEEIDRLRLHLELDVPLKQIKKHFTVPYNEKRAKVVRTEAQYEQALEQFKTAFVNFGGEL